MSFATKALELATARLAPSRHGALGAVERISALTHLVSSAEYLTQEHDRAPGGLNHWESTRQNFAFAPRPMRTLLDRVSTRRSTRRLHRGRIAAAVALLLPTPAPVRAGAGFYLATTSALLYPRHHYGTDGSDQVAFLVQATTTTARLARRNPQVQDACLWYIGLQSTLSYAVSGWVKLASRTWRSGDALAGVMRTQTYGHPLAFSGATRFRRTATVLGKSVLAMECLFPLVFVGRGRLAPAFVGAAASFHIGNGFVMGLGRFVTAFTSMHPAVLYVTAPNPGGRDDTLPRLALVGAAGVLAAGAVGQWARGRRVRAGHPTERRTITRHGHELGYRVHPARGDANRVFVLENGMVATSEHWSWIADGLRDQGTVVTYNRAGYGSSTGDPSGEANLDAAVDDLVDLVRHVAPDQPVVLLGHSLGGWLALRASRELDNAESVVFVDSSHPSELARSSRQAKGLEGLTQSLGLFPASLRAGLGWLLDTPEWITRLPQGARDAALDHYRDPRMWTAGVHEWASVRAEFAERAERPLPSTHATTLSLTAERTKSDDPAQLEMHQELANAGTDGVHEVIVGSDHDTILTGREHAREVVAAVARFVATPSRTLRKVS